MTPADRIIGKFGSVRALARKLGHENHTTVQGWRERGTIPVRHAPVVIAAGSDLADPVVPGDFIPDGGSEGATERGTSEVAA